jgi:hypothetical protein
MWRDSIELKEFGYQLLALIERLLPVYPELVEGLRFDNIISI